jgi:hypothetical protein
MKAGSALRPIGVNVSTAFRVIDTSAIVFER